MTVYTLENNALSIDMHHIISDGTSLSILVTELCKIYSNQILPEINIDYKDYASIPSLIYTLQFSLDASSKDI